MPGAGAGVQAPEASPGRYVRRHDEVTPDDDGCDGVFRVAVRGPGDDPFDIPAKRAPVERLRRWRQAALVLNASRRFRYTLDLKKEEEKEHIRRKIRAHAQVIRAALLFKEAGEKQNGDRELQREVLSTRPGGLGLPWTWQRQSTAALHRCTGLTSPLQVTPVLRATAYNTYPAKWAMLSFVQDKLLELLGFGVDLHLLVEDHCLFRVLYNLGKQYSSWALGCE
ncbi:uncharacterized protein LOC124706167 isoform X1 [Lolium rigidum]|uniref:uncharacterized protein LOC124706167 isoform X1 n=1 Tax=Lolium rigidum TaxID=89674 RepID=UPI001F5C3040|nr:uncharacterized protein LOC124706167 isoform X1 [Lolium rigidum]